MNINYLYSESKVKPKEIEADKYNTYLRKNIRFDNDIQMWVYEEACLTLDEFEAYSKLSGIDNQLTIMEAIADLYDAISGMA